MPEDDQAQTEARRAKRTRLVLTFLMVFAVLLMLVGTLLTMQFHSVWGLWLFGVAIPIYVVCRIATLGALRAWLSILGVGLIFGGSWLLSGRSAFSLLGALGILGVAGGVVLLILFWRAHIQAARAARASRRKDDADRPVNLIR